MDNKRVSFIDEVISGCPLLMKWLDQARIKTDDLHFNALTLKSADGKTISKPGFDLDSNPLGHIGGKLNGGPKYDSAASRTASIKFHDDTFALFERHLDADGFHVDSWATDMKQMGIKYFQSNSTASNKWIQAIDDAKVMAGTHLGNYVK